MSLQSFDDVGARMLADALAEARRAKVALQVQQGPSSCRRSAKR
jgi:hypothetical protein